MLERYGALENSVLIFGFYEGTYKLTQKSRKVNFVCEYNIANDKIILLNQYTDTVFIAAAMM
jgi:uncharacterized protein